MRQNEGRGWIFVVTVLAVATVLALVTLAEPASADDWRHRHRGHGGGSGKFWTGFAAGTATGLVFGTLGRPRYYAPPYYGWGYGGGYYGGGYYGGGYYGGGSPYWDVRQPYYYAPAPVYMAPTTTIMVVRQPVCSGCVWDGQRWWSPDRRLWWNGTQWVPVQ